MNTAYNRNQTAVAITGDHSPWAVHAETEVVEQLGGDELAYHEIKRLQNNNLFPRMGSASKPLTLRDLAYARENEQRGEKYWRWLQLEGHQVRRSTGYDYVYGYGHATDNGYVIVDRTGNVIYDVH